MESKSREELTRLVDMMKRKSELIADQPTLPELKKITPPAGADIDFQAKKSELEVTILIDSENFTELIAYTLKAKRAKRRTRKQN